MSHLCRLSELPDPGSRGFRALHHGQPVDIFAVRHGARVTAWINRCPHRGMPLEWQEHQFLDETGEHIVCATHGALFAPEDGRCLGGPCRGQGLEPVPVRVAGDAVLFADPAWRLAP